MPMTGQPILAARSISLHIFSPMTSPSEPPKTVKSWLKTHTRRPSIVPWPVTTASPQGRLRPIPNSDVRWRTNVSSSWKDPGSSSFSMRSRAVYLPRSCCLASASGEEWKRRLLGLRLRLGLGLGLGDRLELLDRLGCRIVLRLGRDLGRQRHLRPPPGGLENHRAACAVALPGDGGLGLQPGDPDLAELAEVAGERGDIRDLRPKLGRAFHERPLGAWL